MKTIIQGTYSQAIIYAREVDTSSLGFLKALCSSPASQGLDIKIMPDVHPSKGSIVGMTATYTDRVIPGLVGYDIGCGVSAYQIKKFRPEWQALDKVIREEVPSGMNKRVKPLSSALAFDFSTLEAHISIEKAYASLGTLGGGNHFIEVDIDSNKNKWLVIHSGSRGTGAEIAEYHMNKAFRFCSSLGIPYELSYLEGDSLQSYLSDLSLMQTYAQLNRDLIAHVIAKKLKFKIGEVISVSHNYIDLANKMIHKGSISAQLDSNFLIPLNMRDGILLVRGKGNSEWNCSAPHGSGRLYTRSEAREKITLNAYRQAMQGVYSPSIGRDTLDESPQAYKDSSELLTQLDPTVEVLDHWKPLYNFKAGN